MLLLITVRPQNHQREDTSNAKPEQKGGKPPFPIFQKISGYLTIMRKRDYRLIKMLFEEYDQCESKF
jgi:hypothetical protein